MQPASEYQIPIQPEAEPARGEVIDTPEIAMSQKQVEQVFASIIEQEYGPRIAEELSAIGQDIAQARRAALGEVFFTKRQE